jgi:hypothetical protein
LIHPSPHEIGWCFITIGFNPARSGVKRPVILCDREHLAGISPNLHHHREIRWEIIYNLNDDYWYLV